MPDWQRLARRRLTPLALDSAREDEIVAELAGHLEDLYADLVRQGTPEEEAVQSALSAAADWDELRREIQRAGNEEIIMNYRVKTLWLPGACTIALSGIVLRLLQIASAPAPHVFWLRQGPPLIVYWQWFVCLPLVGAIGAYWSRRAGGKLLERALAASFPVLGLMGLPMLILPFLLIFRWLVHRDVLLVPAALVLLIWVVLPEAALLLGALPFFRRDASAQPGQAVASL
jgi:hypothetical protein